MHSQRLLRSMQVGWLPHRRCPPAANTKQSSDVWPVSCTLTDTHFQEFRSCMLDSQVRTSWLPCRVASLTQRKAQRLRQHCQAGEPGGG
jgi:hypothetical protein